MTALLLDGLPLRQRLDVLLKLRGYSSWSDLSRDIGMSIDTIRKVLVDADRFPKARETIAKALGCHSWSEI